MRYIKCAQCLSFATDEIFTSVRNKLTDKGIDWISLKPTPQGQSVKPAIDEMFYDKTGLQAVIDGRGYEVQNVTAEISSSFARIKFITETTGGMMSMQRSFTSNTKYNVYFDVKSAQLCMSTEHLVLFSVTWLKTKKLFK